MSSLAEIFNYSQQIPNWAPNERFLPNADYGRVGALKLAQNVFGTHVFQYVIGADTEWGRAGRYHFYLIGKDFGKLSNEKARVELTTTPNYGAFYFGQTNPDIELGGPLYFRQVVTEIVETARIYGFSPQVLTSAVLTHIHGHMVKSDYPTHIAGMPAYAQEGARMARYNFPLLEGLWGIRGSGYPSTFNRAKGAAARKDYGGKGKRNGGKRRNGGRMKRRRF